MSSMASRCRMAYPIPSACAIMNRYSIDMERNCTSWGAPYGIDLVFTDVGLAAGDTHTMYTGHPELVALASFLDFLYLMDAQVIIRTASSFSGTVARIKGMRCQLTVDTLGRGMQMCLPVGCAVVPMRQHGVR